MRNIGNFDYEKELKKTRRRVKEIIKKCRRIVKCDTARIINPLGKRFLVIGFNRNTKDNKNYWWERNGKRYDFDYVEEQVIASGNTEDELIASAKEYKRLCNITMEEYLLEQIDKRGNADTASVIKGFEQFPKNCYQA